MTQPDNDPAALLRNIKVPPQLPAAQKLIDFLITAQANNPTAIPSANELTPLLLASHLQVVNYIGGLEATFSNLGGQQ